jgi:hypothetical protein
VCRGATDRGLDIVLHRLALETGPALAVYVQPQLSFRTFAFDVARHAPSGLLDCWRRATVPPPLRFFPEFEFLLDQGAV